MVAGCPVSGAARPVRGVSVFQLDRDHRRRRAYPGPGFRLRRRQGQATGLYHSDPGSPPWRPRLRRGAREGAGRKSKAEEQSLIEKLTPLEPIAFEALTKALNDGKDWAVKLFFQYNFGMPKQVIDQNSNVTIDNFSLKDVISFNKPKSNLTAPPSIRTI